MILKIRQNIRGGGILNPTPNPNILKGTKDFTAPFIRSMPKFVKGNVTYIKLINDNGSQNTNVSQKVTLEPNTHYTISFDVFSDVEKTKADFIVNDTSGNLVSETIFTVTNKLKRVRIPFLTTDEIDVSVSIYSALNGADYITDQVYIGRMKLEKELISIDYE